MYRETVFVYIDDLIILGTDKEDVFHELEETLRTASLDISWKKYEFLNPWIRNRKGIH